MKNKFSSALYIPSGLIVGYIILFLFLFLSCSVNDHPPENKHSVIIDLDNLETYQFADLNETDFDDMIKENGAKLFNGHSYSYTIEGDRITLETGLRPLEIRLFTNAITPEYRLLEISDNNTVTYRRTLYEYVVPVYPWSN